MYEPTSDSRLMLKLFRWLEGFTDEAAGEALNQAEKIEDGSRIYVPTERRGKSRNREQRYFRTECG